MPMPRRDHAEGLESLLSPFQEFVSLAISLEFHFEIQAQGLRRPEKVHLHRVIDHQIHRHQRLDDLGIFLQAGDCGAHGGEIHQERNAGEILEHDAGDDEGNFLLGGRLGVPRGQSFDVLLGHFLAVAIAEHRFEDDADADGQSGDLPEPLLFQGWQGIVQAGLAFAGVKGAQCVDHR